MDFRLINYWIVKIVLIWRIIASEISLQLSSNQHQLAIIDISNVKCHQIQTIFQVNTILETITNNSIEICNKYLPYSCNIISIQNTRTNIQCISVQNIENNLIFNSNYSINYKYQKHFFLLENFNGNRFQCYNLSFISQELFKNLMRESKKQLKILIGNQEFIRHYQKGLTLQCINNNNNNNINNNNNNTQHIRLLQQNTNTSLSYFTTYHQNCNQRCQKCDSQSNKCLICKTGYYLVDDNYCIPKFYLYLSSTIMSYSFGILEYPLLVEIVFMEFGFYQYHQIMLEEFKEICQFLGSVNRQKYIPFYVRNTVPNLYKLYQEWKYNQIPQNRIYQTSKQFINKQKKAIYFISNIVDIVIWYILTIFPIFLVFRGVKKILKRLQIQWQIINKCSSWYFLLLVVIQSQSQYIMFMVCRALSIRSFQLFNEKAWLGVSIGVGFVVIVINVAGYAIYSNFCSQKMLEKLYPYPIHHKFQTMCVKFIDGNGRWLLIGIIQGSHNNCALSMFFLLLISIVLTINTYLVPVNGKGNRFLNKNLFVIILDIFCIFGLFSHLNVGRNPVFHYSVQYVCLVVMVIMSIVEIICILLEFIIIAIDKLYCLINGQIDKKTNRIDNKIKQLQHIPKII